MLPEGRQPTVVPMHFSMLYGRNVLPSVQATIPHMSTFSSFSLCSVAPAL